MVYVGKGEEEPARPFILTFDANEEKFGMMETPFAVICSYLCPLVFNGKLALTERKETPYY